MKRLLNPFVGVMLVIFVVVGVRYRLHRSLSRRRPCRRQLSCNADTAADAGPVNRRPAQGRGRPAARRSMTRRHGRPVHRRCGHLRRRCHPHRYDGFRRVQRACGMRN